MKRLRASLSAPIDPARRLIGNANCARFGRSLVASALLAGAALAMAPGSAEAAAAPLQASCQLHSPGNKIKRVVYIIFDNVHLRRDNPNVPSDLEQMPNLLNFLQGNGVVSGNHFTPLISHTADDILTGLTGVYGDRHGSPVSNSFGIYKADNSSAVFQTSFVYWTTTTAQSHPEAGENLPVLVNENGKNAPAPWVVYTRAGCDVGAFSLNGLAIENKTDIANIFGSSVASTAATQDYEGVAIHCAKGSSLCGNSFAKPDLLPDEPGGYSGFSALYGNINVQPVISPSGPVTDLDGIVITDPFSNKPGFPTDFDPSATASLGYAAKMLEAGIPVVYTYVADAHDPHHLDVPNAGAGNPNSGHAYGPGEAGYVAALKAYDQAFGNFFSPSQSGRHRREQHAVRCRAGRERPFCRRHAEPGQLRRRYHALHLRECRRDRGVARQGPALAADEQHAVLGAQRRRSEHVHQHQPGADRRARPGPWSMTSTHWSPPARSPATATSCRCCWPTGPK